LSDNAPSQARCGSILRAAVLLGLISSTFSTLVSQLAAGRIGRDPAVDWMSVAAIPARDWALTSEPSATAIAVGIGFHQWADFSWALFFFLILGRWTAKLRPATLAPVALPWALFTSGFEWLVLVPLFPFWQPIFTLQQPYWIGFLVHLASASMYPLFPLLRRGWRLDRRSRRFVSAWIASAIAGLAGLGVAAALARYDREAPWIGRDAAQDQTFLRHMSTHHEQGVELALLAAERAQDPHLQSLAKLMAASQRGENRIFARWWRSWFDRPMEICSAAERAVMPGYLRPEEVQRLRTASAAEFDTLFIGLMTRHHAGAVQMADSEWRDGSELRLRIMAHAIRHAQQGEIALMNATHGQAAVILAVRNMFADNINP
jgi:uncharacterized protein (DUF305 family)